MKKLTNSEVKEHRKSIGAQWTISGEEKLSREWKFPDFAKALAFTNLVGAQAEKLNHHPDIFLSWGKVKLELTTHDAGGLTESDFKLSALCDQLIS